MLNFCFNEKLMKASKLKKKPASKRTPYSKASDDEKVARNWKKAMGLYKRGEYSVAVLRCGTCVELAVNFAVRQELVVERNLPLPFVDKLLKSANGLRNKYYNIYLPIMAEWEEHDALKKLWKDNIDKINQERNAIAHSGEFRSKQVAQKVMKYTSHVLHEIMELYDHNVKIKAFET
jgi:hypothetical protein